MSLDKNNSAPIPTSRLSRLARLGTLASGVAGSMIAEGAKQYAQGNRPSASDLLLTPANAKRIAEQLAKLRGAAMKVGQLLSMDAGDLLPPELTEILATLREEAKPMPLNQLVAILEAEWGKEWMEDFKQFSFDPIAAASIGQVHSANTQDGRHMALKIQYPGIKDSIESDVDNVAALIRMSGLLPKDLDINPLLDEAKEQLKREADYLQEGQYLNQYRMLLGNHREFHVPEMYKAFTTPNILAMGYAGGQPIESLSHSPQETRDQVMTWLIALLFKEIFEFRLIQTDPNFANYRYDAENNRVVLLDFGATREYPEKIANVYKQLMHSTLKDDRDGVNEAAESIGFFQANIKDEQRKIVIDVLMQACEPIRREGLYDFGSSNLAGRIRDVGMSLSTEKDLWHTPPADAIFLHRKIGGLYLLAAKLRARVDVQSLFLQHI